ncbi:MAG: hypothetical protein R3A79_07525 [Nannocystaceae bacterium]
MDPRRVDRLLQYALACAAQREPPVELSPRALALYVYAADLAHAQATGEPCSGAAWYFDGHGPQAPEVDARVAPAMAAIGVEPRPAGAAQDAEEDADAADDRADEGDGDGEDEEDDLAWGEGGEGRGDALELARPVYVCGDRGLLDALDGDLPLRASRGLRRAFRGHGSDLRGLLGELLCARPLLAAAPGERLDLRGARGPAAAAEEARDGATAKQRKRRGERLREIRAALAQRREARGPGRDGHRRLFLPTFDAAVIAGLVEVAGLAPGPAGGDRVTRRLRIDPACWGAPLRSCDDVP